MDGYIELNAFSPILDNSLGVWAAFQSAVEWDSEISDSWLGLNREITFSFDLKSFSCIRAEQKYICISRTRDSPIPEVAACWMLVQPMKMLLVSISLVWSSIARSVCDWPLSLLESKEWVPEIPVSNLGFARERKFVPTWFKITSLCQSAMKIEQHICMYVCMHTRGGGGGWGRGWGWGVGVGGHWASVRQW